MFEDTGLAVAVVTALCGTIVALFWLLSGGPRDY